jgi:hypothetical protein
MSDIPPGENVAAVQPKVFLKALGVGTWNLEFDLLTDGTYRPIVFTVNVGGAATSPPYKNQFVQPPGILHDNTTEYDAAWINRSELSLLATLLTGSPTNGARVSLFMIDVICVDPPVWTRPRRNSYVIG